MDFQFSTILKIFQEPFGIINVYRKGQIKILSVGMVIEKFLAFACACSFISKVSGSSEPKKETKTCSMEEAGMKMSIKMDAEDDVIKKMEMSYVFPGSMLGGDVS